VASSPAALEFRPAPRRSAPERIGAGPRACRRDRRYLRRAEGIAHHRIEFALGFVECSPFDQHVPPVRLVAREAKSGVKATGSAPPAAPGHRPSAAVRSLLPQTEPGPAGPAARGGSICLAAVPRIGHRSVEKALGFAEEPSVDKARGRWSGAQIRWSRSRIRFIVEDATQTRSSWAGPPWRNRRRWPGEPGL